MSAKILIFAWQTFLLRVEGVGKEYGRKEEESKGVEAINQSDYSLWNFSRPFLLLCVCACTRVLAYACACVSHAHTFFRG
jgi:hypothetical protein